MKKIGVATATLLAAGVLASNSAQAIGYGIPDCDEAGANCRHPNVVMLGTYRDDGRTSGLTCSGTLIDHIDGYYLFLTAAHCTIQWSGFIALGSASSMGVSFDGKVEMISLPSGVGGDTRQFAPGGVAVTHQEFHWGHWGENDYGIISVPEGAVNEKWSNAPTIPFVVLPEEVGFSLDELVASTPKPQQNLKFYGVGYGLTERLNFGSNAGGPSTVFDPGTRRVAEQFGFDNLRKLQLKTSQNPALGDDGTCGGDSGSPAFYVAPSGAVTVQVGVASWGDHICRATGNYSRTDIESFRSFIDCAREHPDNVKVCGY